MDADSGNARPSGARAGLRAKQKRMGKCAQIGSRARQGWPCTDSGVGTSGKSGGGRPDRMLGQAGAGEVDHHGMTGQADAWSVRLTEVWLRAGFGQVD